MVSDVDLIGRSHFIRMSDYPFKTTLFPSIGVDSVDYVATVLLQKPEENFLHYHKLWCSAARNKIVLPKESEALQRKLKEKEILHKEFDNATLECRINPEKVDDDYIIRAKSNGVIFACYDGKSASPAGRLLESPLGLFGLAMLGSIGGYCLSPDMLGKMIGAIGGAGSWAGLTMTKRMRDYERFYEGLRSQSDQQRTLTILDRKLSDRPKWPKFVQLHKAAEVVFNIERYKAGISMTYRSPNRENVERFAQEFSEDKVVIPRSEWEP